MKTKIINYIKQKKLLSILISVYFILVIISIGLLSLKGEQIVAPDSSIGSLLGLKNPNTQNGSSVTSTAGKNSNGSSNGSTSSKTCSDCSNGSQLPYDELLDVVAFYSDSQEDTDAEDINHQRVVNYILSSGANPIFHAGDIMEDGTQNSFDRFLNVTTTLRANRTFYAALGNNDRKINDSTTASPIWLDFFNFPNNEKWYSVDIGSLHLVVLDSAFSSIAPGSLQYNWLISDLQSEASQSRITGVMFHHPTLLNSISGVLSENHVDFTISGHIHSYGRSVSGGVNNFTLSGQPSIGYIIARVYSQNVLMNVYNSNNELIDSVDFNNR